MRALSVLLAVLSLVFATACSRVETQLFVVDVTNAARSTVLIRVAGNNQSPTLKTGEGAQFKVRVPCSDNGYGGGGITNPSDCRQCFTVVAVKVATQSVSRDYNRCISQNEIFSVTFRETDFQ